MKPMTKSSLFCSTREGVREVCTTFLFIPVTHLVFSTGHYKYSIQLGSCNRILPGKVYPISSLTSIFLYVMHVSCEFLFSFFPAYLSFLMERTTGCYISFAMLQGAQWALGLVFLYISNVTCEFMSCNEMFPNLLFTYCFWW